MNFKEKLTEIKASVPNNIACYTIVGICVTLLAFYGFVPALLGTVISGSFLFLFK